jgi:hypothetical protein
MIEQHYDLNTGKAIRRIGCSRIGASCTVKLFIKVMPKDYKAVLEDTESSAKNKLF